MRMKMDSLIKINLQILDLINIDNDKIQFEKLENALKDNYNMITVNN